MKLLIIDGSNIVMRASFGGEIGVEQSVKTATGMIERAIRDLEATHFMVAMDCPGVETWRKKLFPEYKAHRMTDTRPWIEGAAKEWSGMGWWVESVGGYEADDVIATISARAQGQFEVLILSSDSDLLQLSSPDVCVCRPMNGGGVSAMTVEMVCKKYGIASPKLLVDLKAMTGEPGDNVPGVEGIGPVRAAKLLADYGTIEDIIVAGTFDTCKMSQKVATQTETACIAKKLITLDASAPVENLLLKLFCLAEGLKMVTSPMTDAEQNEFIYHYSERLRNLCGQLKPNQQQISMAIKDAESAVDRMRL